MDNAVTHWINALSGHTDAGDAAMLAISSFGAPIMVIFVIALWWIGSPATEVRYSCITAIASLFLGFVLAHLWLITGPRIKPSDAGVSHLLVPLSPYRVFLTDHAIAATGLVFAFALSRTVPVWTAILAFMAALICFARIYVGLHYASDIFADIGVGLVAAIIIRTVYRPETRLNTWLVNQF